MVGDKLQELIVHDLKAIGMGLNKVLHDHLENSI